MASILKRTYQAKTPDGRTVTRRCQHYTIEYTAPDGRRKRAKGYKDKGATLQLAAKLERAAARGEEGLVDPYREHRGRPIKEHVADYLADLRSSGCDDKYVYNTEKRLAVLVAACGWGTLADVEPNGFIRWREKRRRETHQGTRKDRSGTSATTLNQYLDTARGLLNWCASVGRAPGVPVMGRVVSTQLSGVNKVEGEKVRKRRALTDKQVAALLAAAPEGRRLVYRVALAAGLRRGELAALLWGDVRLSAIPPYFQLRAEATKANRADRTYLPASLADDLRKHRPKGAEDSAHVFPSVPSLEQWQADLKAAGIEYVDAMGRQADFHGGTRKTLCTRMHRAGVPLATAMRVMRHTDARLTMVDYADDAQLGVDQVLPEIAAKVPAKGGTRAKKAAGGGAG